MKSFVLPRIICNISLLLASDPEASDIVSKAMGNGKKVAKAVDGKHVKPSRKALENIHGDAE